MTRSSSTLALAASVAFEAVLGAGSVHAEQHDLAATVNVTAEVASGDTTTGQVGTNAETAKIIKAQSTNTAQSDVEKAAEAAATAVAEAEAAVAAEAEALAAAEAEAASAAEAEAIAAAEAEAAATAQAKAAEAAKAAAAAVATAKAAATARAEATVKAEEAAAAVAKAEAAAAAKAKAAAEAEAAEAEPVAEPDEGSDIPMTADLETDEIELRSDDGLVSVKGVITAFEDGLITIKTSYGIVGIEKDGMECVGASCPPELLASQ